MIRINVSIDKNVLDKKLVYKFSHRILSKPGEDLLTNGGKYALKTQTSQHIEPKNETRIHLSHIKQK